MVERIRIEPNLLRIKNSAGNTTFDSNNLYLKKVTSGQFKIGGYSRIPIAIGYVHPINKLNWVYDQTEYGYLDSGINTLIGSALWYQGFSIAAVPPISKFILSPVITNTNFSPGSGYYSYPWASSYTNIRLNNVIIGTGRWWFTINYDYAQPNIPYIAIGSFQDVTITGDGSAGGTLSIDAVTTVYEYTDYTGTVLYDPNPLASFTALEHPAESGAGQGYYKLMLNHPSTNLNLAVTP